MHPAIKSGTCLIFDFDDTLVTSSAVVYVYRASGETLTLTSTEFAKFKPLDTDIMDFSMFEIFPPDVAQTSTFKHLLDALKVIPSSTFIVSARSNPVPIKAALGSLGANISNSHIFAVGNADPQNKRHVVTSILEKLPSCNMLYVFEDNMDNIQAIHTAAKDKGIKYSFDHVNH